MSNGRVIAGVVAGLAALTAAGIILAPRDRGTFGGKLLHCVIISGDFVKAPGRLEAGYNYELLERFARSVGSRTDTRVVREMPHFADSLCEGTADLVVLPLRDSLQVDSLFISMPVDSVALWLINAKSRSRLKEINSWLEEYHASPLRERLHREFLEVPVPGGKADFISPYDSLMREVCAPLKEDWRLLAAIAYQESRFRIEALSGKGAAGLMQLMPVTAGRYGVENPADPRQSLEAGAKYLQHLKKKFRRRVGDAEELRRFVLAAYNAGESRLADILNYADAIEADCRSWAALKEIIAVMDEEVTEGNEEIRHGSFDGGETVAFVESVERRYGYFRKNFE